MLDREFSYSGLLEAFEAEGMKFVIRLNTGTRPTFIDGEGKEVKLSLPLGQRVNWLGLSGAAVGDDQPGAGGGARRLRRASKTSRIC